MKVLFVHNYYQQPGGEDTVLEAELNLMTEHGHQVSLARQDNRAISSFISKARVFIDVAYSDQYKQWMAEKLTQFKPDVVHIHNFFPRLSPAIYDACLDSGVPTVQTLHNYRMICPGALLLRNGQACEKCVKGSPYHAVVHRCYKNSVVGSFAVAKMVDKHRKLGTWNHKVTRFIALTNFARSKFVAAGFPEHKISIKPNFSKDQDLSKNNDSSDRQGALFVGRLSVEKGVTTLTQAWRDIDITLKIAGTGELEGEIAKLAPNTVKMLGALDRESVLREMAMAAFLVMPSKCYETFGMVLIEAFSQGLPVIVSNIGSMAELVENGVTGLHFEAGNADDLAEKVRWMCGHPQERCQMGLNARKEYEKNYTAEKNYEMLIGIYQQSIAEVIINE